MPIPLVAKSLTLVGLLALGSTVLGQMIDTPSTGNGDLGTTFRNRSPLGSTLSPGDRNLFGSKAMSNSQGGAGQDAASLGRGNRRPGDLVGVKSRDARRFVGAAQAAGAAEQGMAGRALSEAAADSAPIGGLRGLVQAKAAVAGIMGQQGGPTVTEVRAKLRAAFEFSPRDPADVSKQLARRLTETPWIHSLTPIQVEVQGRTAILRGQVAAEHDRVLAGQMARLEVGIEQVHNEIVVAGPSRATEEAAAGPP